MAFDNSVIDSLRVRQVTARAQLRLDPHNPWTAKRELYPGTTGMPLYTMKCILRVYNYIIRGASVPDIQAAQVESHELCFFFFSFSFSFPLFSFCFILSLLPFFYYLVDLDYFFGCSFCFGLCQIVIEWSKLPGLDGIMGCFLGRKKRMQSDIQRCHALWVIG